MGSVCGISRKPLGNKSSDLVVRCNVKNDVLESDFGLPPFSLCAGSLKLNDMVMSDSVVELTTQRLTAPKAEVIAWLETDTRLDSHASWRRLAARLGAAGYECFLDGGQRDEDGNPTPVVNMSLGGKERKKSKECKASKKGSEGKEGKGGNECKGKDGPRFAALLLAVRSDLRGGCCISPEIAAEVRLASGAKGVLQRGLSVRGATIVVLGTSYSSKDKERFRQVTKIKSDVMAMSMAATLISGDNKLATEHALIIQRRWRRHQDRNWMLGMQYALASVPGAKPKSLPSGTSPTAQRYTFVCVGDQNMRIYSQDGWSRQESGGASSLTPDAVDKVVELLRSHQGRMELLGWVETQAAPKCGPHAQLHEFYDKTHWWRDGNGTIGIPTYKRTPYFQTFPALAPTGEFAEPQVITTEELLKYAQDSGDASMIQQVEILAAAEGRGFIDADPALLKREFFGMRDTVPVSKEIRGGAQTFLKEDAKGNNVYMQLGWLDTLSFKQGPFTNFESQKFRCFDVVPQVHAHDHLLTIGVLDFKPGRRRRHMHQLS